ncbi:hypothetical protein OG563_26890 [Nocardia vinacea]|uniref:HTH cro/C1-type domain-containing protein n=1 Tax=Nocardia vinacea TaxID=96468 RepID=A0ABZ1YM83_9NOCA|nr:hypothetical protein [Nocardia vinacea]
MARGKTAAEPWASAMIAKGYTNPRTGEPSMRLLAEAADLGPATVHRLIGGESGITPDPRTIRKIAAALDQPVRIIREWLAVDGVGWQPPAGMDILTAEDVEALDAIIARLIKMRRKINEQDDKLASV